MFLNLDVFLLAARGLNCYQRVVKAEKCFLLIMESKHEIKKQKRMHTGYAGIC